jgi:hypothetical protein
MKRKTHAEFLAQIAELPVEPIDQYAGNTVKIRFRCTDCGHIRKVSPEYILSGHKCRGCWRIGLVKKPSEFEKQIAERPFVAIDRYSGYSDKIRFRCHVCLRVWKAVPRDILSGCGCPYCAVGGRKKCNDVISDHGDWLEIDVASPTKPSEVMLIDQKDWDILLQMNIGRIYTDGYGYPTISINKSHRAVHNLLFPDAIGDIDHIDRNPRNNRRQNLRECTHAENRRNSKKYRNNSSGVTGVYWHSQCKKWAAEIKVDYKKIYLGLFSSLEEAAGVRKAAEIKYFGKFRPYRDASKAWKNYSE